MWVAFEPGMVRASALPLLTVLALAGCGLSASVERSFAEDEARPPATSACEGIACGPCPPAITLRVIGEPGRPAPEVSLFGVSGYCGAMLAPVRTECWVSVYQPGEHAFEVHAPGYRTASVRTTVPVPKKAGGCCDCGYEDQVVEVTLEPL